MKVRWRDHEMTFVSILIIVQSVISLLPLYNPYYTQPGTDYASGFNESGVSFAYWQNVALPQMSVYLLIYLGYLLINLVILPAIKKISYNDFEKLLAPNLLKSVLAIVASSYLLAIGANTISYFARPHLFNYSGYQFLGLLGYNDIPLSNLLFGFGRALGLVLLFVALVGLRDFSIWLIERPGEKRAFRVLIANNATSLLFFYFVILYFTNPIHEDFRDYMAWITPVLALYIYFTFSLFPYKVNYSWLNRGVLVRLLIPTFAGALFSTIVFSGRHKLLEFSIYWTFLLLIVTPLTWILYQHRKDKILSLRGMETALAKSNTDLQFLRSQINPHFLFNTLNTLHGTAWSEKSEKTAEGIQMLGDMMRFMLHENNLDYIPLSKETNYLKNYIALQKLRIPATAGIVIEDNIDDVKCIRQIAPMLLIPFIENAFKHGISLREKSWIKVSLHCSDTRICLEVRNSLHSLSQVGDEKDKSGIGLKNIAERLKLLYPGKHDLEVIKEEKEFIAKLVLR